MGGRLRPIEAACHAIDRIPDTKIVRTSGLWNTKAMYVTNQDDFLNGVCEIHTRLSPLDLLDALQAIETELGRVKVIDKGPRVVDLDILMYEDLVFESERLSIPHKLMLERDFVLRPLCQLIPSQEHPAGEKGMTFQHYLDKLDEKDPKAHLSITPLTFLSENSEPLTPLLSSRRTQIMSILNFTPDSFWDGGIHDPQNPDITFTQELLQNSDIFDIGGESTRPGSQKVSTDEELSRVLPAIEFASSAGSFSNTISIDTYHADVASAALRAGAHMVNDISAGRLDANMFRVVTEHDAAIVLMHSRGTPQTMMSKENLDYGDDILMTVASELAEQVVRAEEAGVRRWRIVLDPGFGFAKTFDQNIALLRGLGTLRQMNPVLKDLPWLIGLSRKTFVRRMAEASSSAGIVDSWSLLPFSNSAALMTAIHGGADIIRVHDPVEAKMLARVADAVWRNRDPLG